MVVKLEKSTNPDYKDTLKVSNMTPKEFVVISKTEFDEPLTGDGKFGPWEKWNVTVHEFNSLDLENGGFDNTSIPAGTEAGFFVSAKGLQKALKDIPLDVKVKITQEAVEGKSYKLYKVEVLDGSVAPEATAKAATPSVSPAAKIQALKAAGLDLQTVTGLVMKEYEGQTADTIAALYNA